VTKDEKFSINKLDSKNGNNNEHIEDIKENIIVDEAKDNIDETKDNEPLSPNNDPSTPNEFPNNTIEENVCSVSKWIFRSTIGRNLFPPLRV
jgi:hypothetical protein